MERNMNNKFCIWCGSTLGENAEFCYHCGKTQPQKENQLVDWLIRHTKGKLQGDAESTVLDAIKNFLKSHIYGTVVSLALVSAVGVTVYANPAYLTRTTAEEFYRTQSQQVFNPSGEENGAFDIEANHNVHDLVGRYLMDINSGNSVENLVVPTSFDYRGNMEVGRDMRFEGDSNRILNGEYNRTEFSPEFFSLPISSQLAAAGYRVGECVVTQRVEDNSGNVVYSRSMLFGCVETQSGWRIFENKILSTEENAVEDIQRNPSDSAEIMSVVSSFMYDVFHQGETDADGNTIGTDEETYWYPGYEGASRGVFVDTRVMEGEGKIKTTTVYMPMFEAENFSFDITKLMYNDGVVVAECYVEEFLDDAATGEPVGYRRTLHSLTKSEHGWRIFENRVEQLIEYAVINANHVIDDWKTDANSQSPYTYQQPDETTEAQDENSGTQDENQGTQITDHADMATYVNWLYDYVEVLFTGDQSDIDRRHYGIYHTTLFESSYYLQNLPQQLNGKTFHQVAIDNFTTDISAMGYPPQIFEQQDYKPVQMDVTVQITDKDGTEFTTKNRLLLLFVDGEYRLCDDVQI